MVFYSKEGERLGNKSSLEVLLNETTGIPIAALQGRALDSFPINERMCWAAGRDTKEKEDRAHCLLGLFGVFMYLNYGEGDNAFARLNKKLQDTSKVDITLPIVQNAAFDAYEQDHGECHPETRVELLQRIRDWANDPNAKRIFWLNGWAGTGKTTVSKPVSRWLAELRPNATVRLGASYFFKRGDADRASAALLFPTIASQLAAQVNQLGVLIAQAVKTHPQICCKPLDEQFKRLVREPLQRLPHDVSSPTYVVVLERSTNVRKRPTFVIFCGYG